jgi:hypothetical protein
VKLVAALALCVGCAGACAGWELYQYQHPERECILYEPPATYETWEMAVRTREGDCMVRMMRPIPPTPLP